ncbi:hypothetical protein KPL76_08360 [Subtercola sp. PAMC28395]|uniref:hypothetical protein n=1 Tax=Subtercola sp. PAMC28395 TaxID=2846775 RepID=UPI001C0C04D9|nr:hypothetical protein [Subtercola sp. PAMC28395]QWT22814.1 hypothetical protein KPL76_08360 [Subtercola sp. PAMC28395]
MRGFWDSIAQLFGYDSWSWGSAGEWAGAIAGLLAFLGTIAIIWIDQQKTRSQRVQERLELANLFSTSLSRGGVENEGGWSKHTMRVDIFNGGSLPVQQGILYAPADKHGVSRVTFAARNDPEGGVAKFDDQLPRVLPNEQFNITWDYATQQDDADFYVEFVDGRGRKYYRRLVDQELVPELPKKYQNLGAFSTPNKFTDPQKAFKQFAGLLFNPDGEKMPNPADQTERERE